jgi:hypothetical protein
MPTEAQYVAVRIAQIRLEIAEQACDNVTGLYAIKRYDQDREERRRSLIEAQDVVKSCK